MGILIIHMVLVIDVYMMLIHISLIHVYQGRSAIM